LEPDVESYVRSLHEDRGISYPPEGITLAAFKEEEIIELWAETEDGPVYIKTYEFCAASGEPGPKLCRGDCQVPEGVYGVAYLNPNSRFHLSLLLDYPNKFDKERGRADGRSDLGSAICIHGGCASIGCIALGDEAIEEIFLVANEVGARNCKTIIAPYDFRTQGLPARYTKAAPKWLPELYEIIHTELAAYGAPA
jgi:murein L,D-transpeptidase YafK